MNPFFQRYFNRFRFLAVPPALFLFFWLHRAHIFAGDGALIARLTQDGKWLVKNELLSQALLQALYQLTQPWHISAMEIMNFTSCTCGVLAVLLLFQLSREWQIRHEWPLLFFLSSGFFIYACGHTEYYPMLLPAMLGYGYAGILFLKHKTSFTLVLLIFILAVSLHLAMLIALLSLIVLALSQKHSFHYKKFWPLLLLIPLFLLREYPQFIGHRAASLSSGWHGLPWFRYEGMGLHYAFFEWKHALDWLYGLAWRSWIFWPAILVGSYVDGFRSLLRNDRLFLLAYTLPFPAWTTIWHPDLGMPNDWDLFALAAAPLLLLALTYIPTIKKIPFLKYCLLTALAASTFCNHGFILKQADFPRQAHGSANIILPKNIESNLTIDSRHKKTAYPRIQEGFHHGKFINQTHRSTKNFYFAVSSRRLTTIHLKAQKNIPK
ncbi:hypothetical protein GF373_14005 [bacterium]|nr:hypothetical protein [bacterium]